MADKSRKQKLAKNKFHASKQNNKAQHHRGEGDNEKWKKKVYHDFKKMKRKESQEKGVDMQKLFTEAQQDRDSNAASKSSNLQSDQPSPPRKKFDNKKQASRFSKAQWEHQKKTEKKQTKFDEIKKNKAEKEAALQSYRAKKKDRFLKLCKRTSKGQPVMKFQMQVLLQKLEQQQKDRQGAGASS